MDFFLVSIMQYADPNFMYLIHFDSISKFRILSCEVDSNFIIFSKDLTVDELLVLASLPVTPMFDDLIFSYNFEPDFKW